MIKMTIGEIMTRISSSQKINKDFYVVPMFEMVKTKNKKMKLVEKTFYIRKNMVHVLFRQIIGEKKNWRKIVDMIKTIAKTPTILVGR